MDQDPLLSAMEACIESIVAMKAEVATEFKVEGNIDVDADAFDPLDTQSDLKKEAQVNSESENRSDFTSNLIPVPVQVMIDTFKYEKVGESESEICSIISTSTIVKPEISSVQDLNLDPDVESILPGSPCSSLSPSPSPENDDVKELPLSVIPVPGSTHRVIECIELDSDSDKDQTNTGRIFCRQRKKNAVSKTNTVPSASLKSKPSSKIFKCDFDKCSKFFSRKTHLDRHKYRIHSKKSFSCQLCSMKFADKSCLDSHCASVHTNACDVSQRRYWCIKCLSSFTSKAGLDIHKATTHMKNQTSKISTSIPFSVSHTGRGPESFYTCSRCKITMRRKNNFEKHLLIHIYEDKDKIVNSNINSIKNVSLECDVKTEED